MALVLSLFSDAEMKGLGYVPLPHSVGVSSVPSEACSSESAVVLDPCVQCRFRGLCDDDYCAMLLHPIECYVPSREGSTL